MYLATIIICSLLVIKHATLVSYRMNELQASDVTIEGWVILAQNISNVFEDSHFYVDFEEKSPY